MEAGLRGEYAAADSWFEGEGENGTEREGKKGDDDTGETGPWQDREEFEREQVIVSGEIKERGGGGAKDWGPGGAVVPKLEEPELQPEPKPNLDSKGKNNYVDMEDVNREGREGVVNKEKYETRKKRKIQPSKDISAQRGQQKRHD